MRVLGMISGTSVDGIDVAVADLDVAPGPGDPVLRLAPVGHATYPYPPALADLIRACLPPARVTMEDVCRLDTGIGQAFAAAAARALDELAGGAADLVASHGQTLFHWVRDGAVHGTLQLGQPAWIAGRTGLPVVADLRSADVVAGGQGAPLVSLVDVWWLRSRPGRPVALNLGGIANVTAGIDSDAPVAFDTGPANALLDVVVERVTQGRQHYDADGARGAAGTVDPAALARLLTEPYYARPAPKSTGKEVFHLGYLDTVLGPDWLTATAPDDAVATVTALTAQTVAAAVLDRGATEVVASGGGTSNPTLMRMLAARLPGVPVRTSDELGLPSDAKEAYAFAVLGWLSAHGLPGTVPSCTGASYAAVLGSITPGRAPLVLPTVAQPPTALVIG